MMALAKEKNDGTVIGMTVSETMGYNIAAATRSPIQFEDFTAIASTAEFQMGIVSLSEKGWKTIDDVVAAAKGGETIRFGVMSPKLADLAYLVGKAQGVDFNIVQVKGGKAVMNGLNAGDLDIGWVAGAQAKGVAAGTMVNLASGLNTPLAMSPNAPTMNDMGVGFDAGGYFMFAAPAGIPEEARQKLATSIAEIVNDSSTKAGGLINKAFGGPAVLTGDELNNYLKGKLALLAIYSQQRLNKTNRLRQRELCRSRPNTNFSFEQTTKHRVCISDYCPRAISSIDFCMDPLRRRIRILRKSAPPRIYR